jgi:hypothetical protein
VTRGPRHGKHAQGVAGRAPARRAQPQPIETHDDLVAALRAIDALDDVGNSYPNFHFRSRPFLHFHLGPNGIYADVRLGTKDFRPVAASTPEEREELLARVRSHVAHVERTRKSRR